MILSLITDLISLTKAASQAGGIVKEGATAINNNKQAINQIFGKAQTIASMAKKRIFDYPVVISNAFGDDIDAAFSIVRYAEASFAYFLLMSMNIDPVVENGNTISAHLGQFSSESIDMKINIISNNKNFSEEDLRILNEIYLNGLQDYQYSQDYKLYNASKEDLAERMRNSSVITHNILIEEQGTGNYFDRKSNQRVNEFGRFIDSNNNEILDNNGNPIQSTDYVEGKLEERSNMPDKLSSMNYDVLSKRIGTSLPTTLTIDLYVGQHKIPVSLAVRAVPHFIPSDEMSDIFKRCVDDGKLLRKLIKLRTGEISFFKDFLLNLKQIEEDKQMYKKLERHPWFRKILDQKIRSNIKGISGLIKSINSLVKDGSYLPSLSLLTTANEISDAISYPFQEAIKKGKIEKILSKLMLLALFVYDQDREIVYAFFNGLKDPYILKLKDLNVTGNKQNDMEKFIASMTQLMVKNY